ncbi:MAG: UDP-3-O-(3-hydroxymyristoyl)glucosamine N-acyltransferase [Deltaproteobacteria bacterium]|nr:UDP-3-O-(3-hydroxymyristoyl)glucosamine N-acyltransferase [Deltaproteobacteria bacterium]
MPEARTLGELAALVGGNVIGDSSVLIKDVAQIDGAGAGDITFVSDKKYLKLLKDTKASAVIVSDEKGAEGLNLLVVKDPQLAFAAVVDVLRPQIMPPAGIHPEALVHTGAVIGKDASIQPFSVIEEGAEIGERTVIFPNVYVGRGAKVGDDCILYSGVAVREGCIIGNRVIIHCNAVVGSDGFGYAQTKTGLKKIPQRGIVRINDDVEVGACVTIDRAAIGETVIGRGTKIDNLVQVAHNVQVGENSVLVAQAGIAGSTKIGNRVMLGGQVGVVGHIEIADDVMIGAKSGVIGNIASKGVYSGIPVQPHTEWLKSQAVAAKLPELKKKLLELEKRIAELEKTKAH